MHFRANLEVLAEAWGFSLPMAPGLPGLLGRASPKLYSDGIPTSCIVLDSEHGGPLLALVGSHDVSPMLAPTPTAAPPAPHCAPEAAFSVVLGPEKDEEAVDAGFSIV